MSAEIPLQTQVCVLKKQVVNLRWLLTVMVAFWGGCMMFIVTVNADQKQTNGKQAEQIRHLEEQHKESREDNKAVLNQLSEIAVAIGRIEEKIK